MAGIGRPKGEDRPRSIRVPCTEEEFRYARQLAGLAETNVADWLRGLIRKHAEKAGLDDTQSKRIKRMNSKE